MGIGGYRSGAGRPLGSEGKKTASVKAIMNNQDLYDYLKIPEQFRNMTPLEVMAYVMTSSLAEGNKTLALSAASQLAPYRSPKLSHVTTAVQSDPAKMSDAELAAMLVEFKPKAEQVDEPDAKMAVTA